MRSETSRLFFFKLRDIDAAPIDDDGRFAAEHRFERFALQIDDQHDLVQEKDGEDRYRPVQKRDGGVSHGNAGELGDQEGDDQLKGLHLADLPLSHQAHHDEERDEYDSRPQYDQSHIDSMRRRKKNIPFGLDVYACQRGKKGI